MLQVHNKFLTRHWRKAKPQARDMASLCRGTGAGSSSYTHSQEFRNMHNLHADG